MQEPQLKELIQIIKDYSGEEIIYDREKQKRGWGVLSAIGRRLASDYSGAPHEETVRQMVLAINADPDFIAQAQGYEGMIINILKRLHQALIAAGKPVSNRAYIDNGYTESLQHKINNFQRRYINCAEKPFDINAINAQIRLDKARARAAFIPEDAIVSLGAEQQFERFIENLAAYSGIQLDFDIVPGKKVKRVRPSVPCYPKKANHRHTVANALLRIHQESNFFHEAGVTSYSDMMKKIIDVIQEALIQAGEYVALNGQGNFTEQHEWLTTIIYSSGFGKENSSDIYFTIVNNTILAKELTAMTGVTYNPDALPSSKTYSGYSHHNSPLQDRASFYHFIKGLEAYSGVELKLPAPDASSTTQSVDQEYSSTAAQPSTFAAGLSLMGAVGAGFKRWNYGDGYRKNAFAEDVATLILTFNDELSTFKIDGGYYAFFKKIAEALKNLLIITDKPVNFTEGNSLASVRHSQDFDSLYSLFTQAITSFGETPSEYRKRIMGSRKTIQDGLDKEREQKLFADTRPSSGNPLFDALIHELEKYTGYKNTLVIGEGQMPSKGFLTNKQPHHQAVILLLQRINKDETFFAEGKNDREYAAWVFNTLEHNLFDAGNDIARDDYLRGIMTAFAGQNIFENINWDELNGKIAQAATTPSQTYKKTVETDSAVDLYDGDCAL